MKNEKKFIYSIYAIFLMAYLTLTATTPILITISIQNHIPLTKLQLGVSLLFLFFSSSSICLGPLSDFLGRRNILLMSQCLCIIGLTICSLGNSLTSICFGLAFVGLGTGSYSVVARSIVNHCISDHNALFKIYSTFSLLIMLGPIISTKLAIDIASTMGWHYVYVLLLLIEITVLLSTYFNIHEPNKNFKPTHISISGITKQFIYCTKEKIFMKNALLVGMFLSIILGLFLALGPELFIKDFHISIQHYSNIALTICLIYMVGNFTAKHVGSRISKRHLKIISFAFMIIGTTLLSFSTTITSITISMFIISFSAGILVPMGTHGGMIVIKQHFGTAAAIYTALFSVFSAFWSYLHTVLNFSPLMLIISIIWIILIFSTIFELLLPDTKPNTLKKYNKPSIFLGQYNKIRSKNN